MNSIEEIFGRGDFDGAQPQEIAEITQECNSTFGEPIPGIRSCSPPAVRQSMAVWFVVADQLVRIQNSIRR